MHYRISYADFEEYSGHVFSYGTAGLRTVTVVSRFNPNKYKTNGKYYDYKYKASDIDPDTLYLKKNTKKDVTLYIYNENRLLTDEVSYGEEKEETTYAYDNGGNGSLVVLETDKYHGKEGSGSSTEKHGYTYDTLRNILTETSSKAYLKKNAGREYLYTTAYAYSGTGAGYPAGDAPYVCPLVSQEYYISDGTKSRMYSTLADNGIDYASISEQRSVNGSDYSTISMTEFLYDSNGNEIQADVYPSYSTDAKKEMIRNDYTYNELGQQTKKTVKITSARRPEDNRTYTEEETVYDYFGNELSYIDENGLVSVTAYDPVTGEETETTNAVGTEHESRDREYVSADGLKTMTLDNYGRVTIDIKDAFGNTIISKDEAAGTWTESTYEYDSNTQGDDDDDSTEGTASRLIEEKTYSFRPTENRFITDENGKKTANFYITGRGDAVLSAGRYYYDRNGNEAGNAQFCNGGPDAAHCSSWSLSRTETSVTGTEDSARTVSITYNKELDPSGYTPDFNVDGYYDSYNNAVLSETINETVTDAEGNTVSQKSTLIRGKNRSESVTEYEYDDYGRTVRQSETKRSFGNGTWKPAYETQTSYTYDANGNVTQTGTKSRKEGETDWQTHVTRSEYNEQGSLIREYTPVGVKENAAVIYDYDILGRQVNAVIPQNKTDGHIEYQNTVTLYDDSDSITAKKEQIDGDRYAVTEYNYDKSGNLVMVKSCPDDNNAQCVQYIYDIQGNKVRMFTGMTGPLTLNVSEVSEVPDDADTFSYEGKTYQITVSGKKKSDTIAETKYEYDGRNQLISYTDPEGRKETYTYDNAGNLSVTVDKNGNTVKNTYDYSNRLTKMSAKEKKTGKETAHTYSYNAYGEVSVRDNTSYTYDDISGQVTKEQTKLTGNKYTVKNYDYDSAGNRTSFGVKVGDESQLSLNYTYDGKSKLTGVTDGNGDRVVDYTYDTSGNLSERKAAGNNLTTTYAYDYQNRLTTLKNSTSGAGTISEYTSEYLANGQKSAESYTKTDTKGNKTTGKSTYTYDLLGRIKKETHTGRKDITYTYDSNNNRKEMKTGNKVTAYRYNKNDELLRTDTLNTDTGKDTVVIYKNDKNGNQLATVNRYEIPDDKKDGAYIDINVTLGDNRLNDNVVNHYNALNQLTQTLTGNYKVEYDYDSDGLLSEKTVNGERTVFVWDNDELVLELSDNGKVQKRYIRGNDLVYADRGKEQKSSNISGIHTVMWYSLQMKKETSLKHMNMIHLAMRLILIRRMIIRSDTAVNTIIKKQIQSTSGQDTTSKKMAGFLQGTHIPEKMTTL